MIEIHNEGMPANVVYATAKGKITTEDYENIFIPEISKKFQLNDKIRLLFHIGQAFEGYSMAAVFEDAKVGLKHLTGFEKTAIVTDINWISYATNFFGLFIKGEVKVFHNDQLEDAKRWIVA